MVCFLELLDADHVYHADDEVQECRIGVERVQRRLESISSLRYREISMRYAVSIVRVFEKATTLTEVLIC